MTMTSKISINNSGKSPITSTKQVEAQLHQLYQSLMGDRSYLATCMTLMQARDLFFRRSAMRNEKRNTSTLLTNYAAEVSAATGLSEKDVLRKLKFADNFSLLDKELDQEVASKLVQLILSTKLCNRPDLLRYLSPLELEAQSKLIHSLVEKPSMTLSTWTDQLSKARKQEKLPVIIKRGNGSSRAPAQVHEVVNLTSGSKTIVLRGMTLVLTLDGTTLTIATPSQAKAAA